MSRHPIVLALASALAASAQPSPPNTPETTPAVAPRTVSPAIAEQLKAALPKLAPVKLTENKTEADSPDLRTIDKPRNEIVRLPSYLVRERKPPVFTDRELLGEHAFGEKLARRYFPEWYLAFNKVAMWTPLRLYMASAANSALAQFYEEERLRQKSEMADLANMVMRSDAAAGKKTNALLEDTFMRWQDFGWQGPSR
jgi:hypothetical protein